MTLGPKALNKPILEEAFEKEVPLVLTYSPENNTSEEENRSIAKAAMTAIQNQYPLDDENYLSASLPCRYEKMKVSGIDIICLLYTSPSPRDS